jgi:hypothetical protein
MWFLEDVQRFSDPIPARGRQGLWEWELPVESGNVTTDQLTLWSSLQTSVATPVQPWPLGVWLRAYRTALRDDYSTIIGQLTAYGRLDDQTTVKLVNACGGAEVPIRYVTGAVSPNDGGPRTGFPRTCPIWRAEPVLALNCQGCEHRRQLPRLVWYCDRVEYQAAPGVHFCLGCGIELGPWAESHGWEWCDGVTGRCRKVEGGEVQSYIAATFESL